MAGPSVLVRVLGDTKDFTRSMDEASRASSAFGDAAGKVGSAISGTLVGAARLAATAMTVAGVAAADFGVKSFQSAARVGTLDSTLNALAKANNLSAESLQLAVKGVKGMGIETAVAQETVAKFVRAELDVASATDLARVAQDAAVVSGKNSTETLDALVHGITTQNTQVLRNAGITVDAKKAQDAYALSMKISTGDMTPAQKQQAMLNAVMAEGAKVAGAYAGAMQEPGKVLGSFPRLFDDIKVTVGKGLVDAFGPVILKLYEFTSAFSKAIGEGGRLRPVLDAVMKKVQELAAPLGKVADKMLAFVKSADTAGIGKIADMIGKLGPAAAGAGTAIGVMGTKNIPVLGQLLGGINPLVAGFAGLALSTKEGREAFGSLAGVIGPLAGDILSGLMPAFRDLMGAVGPLIPIIANLAGTVLRDLFSAIQPLLPTFTEVAGILAGALGQAFKALTPSISLVVGALGDIIGAVAPLLPDIARLVAVLLDLAIKAIIPLVPPLLELVKAALIPMLPAISSLLPPLIQLAVALTPLIVLVSKLLAEVIGLISKGLTPVIKFLADLTATILNRVIGAVTSMIKIITDVANTLAGFGRKVGEVIGTVTDFFGSLPGKINSALGGIPGQLLSAATGWMTNMLSGVSSGWSAVWNFFTGIPGNITRAIGNIDLFDVGRRILDSLRRGAESMVNAVLAPFKSVADKISGLWPFSPAKWGPLRLHPPERGGANIGRMLAAGMASQEAAVERSARSLAGAAIVDGTGRFQMAGTGGSSSGAAPAVSAAPAGPAVIIQNATFEDQTDIDLLMRRVTWAAQGRAV